MDRARTSKSMRLVSIALSTLLAGCKFEEGVGGIGGNTDMYSDDVIYFLPDETKRELEEQAERTLDATEQQAADGRRK